MPTTPRVFIVRHGETEWSLNGRHTSTTELPLTANGEKRVRATGRALVGEDRLIVPGSLAHIYVSPRSRARRTLELLDLCCRVPYPWQQSGSGEGGAVRTEAKTEVLEAIREWDYGAYEGLTSTQIRELRSREGKDGVWDIWRDGCEGGESPEDVTRRLDSLITEIRTRFHEPALIEEKKGDVLVVAHGHILRALAMRWVGKGFTDGVGLLLEAGGVGTLSYEHGRIEEPAILLGGAFTVDVGDVKS